MNRRNFFALLAGAAAFLSSPIKLLAAPKSPSKKWMLCDGRYLNREDYSDLFDVLGNQFGGFKEYWDVEMELFRLPDMRARVVQPVIDSFHTHHYGIPSGAFPSYVTSTVPYNHYIKTSSGGDYLAPVGTIIMYAGSEESLNN